MNDFNHHFLNNMFSFYYYNTIPTCEQVFSFLFIKFFWAFMLRSTIHLPPIEEGEFLLCYVKHTHTSHNCQQVSFICFCQSRITLPSVPSSYGCPGDCICNFSHLQIIPALYLWLHSHFFSFVDYLLLYTCDRIRNFSHL